LDGSRNPADYSGMADHENSDSADLQVILERTDPARNVARCYILSVEAGPLRSEHARAALGMDRVDWAVAPGVLSAVGTAPEKRG
jgi:hypothetical protein